MQHVDLYFLLPNVHNVVKPHLKKKIHCFLKSKKGWWVAMAELGKEGGMKSPVHWEVGQGLNFVENGSHLL